MSLIPYTAGGGHASGALLTFASSGIKYIHSASSSQTYSSQGIGVASSDRVVLVSIYSVANTTSVVQSITCGGVSMTELEAVNYGSYGKSAIWGVAYPTGTTADIVVTYLGAPDRNCIGVHALTGTAGDFTKFDAASDSGSHTMSTTLDIPANGAVLVTAGSNESGAFSADAGFTEDWEESNTSPATGSAGGGSASLLAAETARTITVTTGGSAYETLLAISFGP